MGVTLVGRSVASSAGCSVALLVAVLAARWAAL
jgi:hypothetical protein